MEIYPNNPPIAVGSSQTIILPTKRSNSQAGYIFTRRVNTRVKNRYTLNYPAITLEQFEIIKNFFTNNQGKHFKFSYEPLTQEEKICVFSSDELDVNFISQNVVSLSIEIVEI